MIVGNLATPDGWRYALGHVSAGAERAGRRPSDLRLVAWLYCALGADPGAAVDVVRPMVATSLVTSRPILRELGIDMPPGFAAAMNTMGWSLAQEAVTRASEEVPDHVVDRLALAGSPAECRPRLRELLDAVPQIAQVAIVPVPLPGRGPRRRGPHVRPGGRPRPRADHEERTRVSIGVNGTSQPKCFGPSVASPASVSNCSRRFVPTTATHWPSAR